MNCIKPYSAFIVINFSLHIQPDTTKSVTNMCKTEICYNVAVWSRLQISPICNLKHPKDLTTTVPGILTRPFGERLVTSFNYIYLNCCWYSLQNNHCITQFYITSKKAEKGIKSNYNNVN